MNIVEKPIDQVIPYEKNAKTHDREQIRKIAASISRFGFNQPIVLDKKGIVIVGHGRLQAARQLGLTTVPTLEVDLDEDRARAYRLADNKLNETPWDMDLVIGELKALKLNDFDINLTGFDQDVLLNAGGGGGEGGMGGGANEALTCPKCGHSWTPDEEE